MIKRYLAGIALLTVITMSGCSAKVQETTADAGTWFYIEMERQ